MDPGANKRPDNIKSHPSFRNNPRNNPQRKLIMPKTNKSITQAAQDYKYAVDATIDAIYYEKPEGKKMSVCQAVLSASDVEKPLPKRAVDLLTRVCQGEILTGSERLQFVSLALNRVGDYAKLIPARVAG